MARRRRTSSSATDLPHGTSATVRVPAPQRPSAGK
jgi:hypothetical protein